MIEKQYKALFLDWDDTIGDWQGAERLALTALYEHYSLAEFYPELEEFIQVYAARNRELWDIYGQGNISKTDLQRERFLYPMLHALDLHFAPKALSERAEKMSHEFLQLTNHYFHLLPDAEEVVKYLAGKYPLTIISNGFGEAQYYKFAHSGLDPYFKYKLISEEVGINKPQPGIFLEALRQNGVEAHEALMIGDRYSSDIAGAKAAGIDQLWITKDPGEETATIIVDELKKIMDIL